MFIASVVLRVRRISSAWHPSNRAARSRTRSVATWTLPAPYAMRTGFRSSSCHAASTASRTTRRVGPSEAVFR